MLNLQLAEQCVKHCLSVLKIQTLHHAHMNRLSLHAYSRPSVGGPGNQARYRWWL